MNKIFIAFLLLLSFTMVKGQSYNTSNSCEVNVNAFPLDNVLNNQKRATFKYASPYGQCTGTMINRNTSQHNLGQYFVSSWHCFKQGTICDGSTLDVNNTIFTLYFNYQSKDANTTSVPENNKGINNYYTINPYNYSDSTLGYRYRHQTRLRLVAHVQCAFGDFALLEILNPVPPHFNIYYSGWDRKCL